LAYSLARRFSSDAQVIEGRSYDERSDLYSLGIVIYEIFSRVLPFTNIPSLLHVTEKAIKRPDALAPHNPNYTKDLVEQCEKQGLEVPS
jgi:serine/threonine protein kinase